MEIKRAFVIFSATLFWRPQANQAEPTTMMELSVGSEGDVGDVKAIQAHTSSIAQWRRSNDRV